MTGVVCEKSEITSVAGIFTVVPFKVHDRATGVGSQLMPVTHAPLHSTCPVGQEQAPAVQVVPAAHFMPQAPQFSGSFWTSMQVALAPVPQAICPPAQPHVPPLHCWPTPHAWLHLPQFIASVWVSTHEPPQDV
jgi:hypothetical protein